MSNSTLVSCYYKIMSKRPHSEYDKYIQNLLSRLENNLVIYTSADLVDYFNIYIENKSNIKIIIKEFEDIPLYKKYLHIWNLQEKLDRSKYTNRTYQCYVLWNSKLNFIKETVELNPFNTDKFMWLDIGAVRTSDIFTYLSTFPKYENISINKIDIVMIEDYQNYNQKFFQDEIHLGGLYGGGIDILLKFHELFYMKFDEYLENNKFIGCDQQIISSVYLENNHLFNIINPNNDCYTESNKLIPVMKNIDIWFYLLYYYSV